MTTNYLIWFGRVCLDFSKQTNQPFLCSDKEVGILKDWHKFGLSHADAINNILKLRNESVINFTGLNNN